MRLVVIATTLCFATVLRAQAPCAPLRWSQPLAINGTAQGNYRAETPKVSVGSRGGFIIANQASLDTVSPPETFPLVAWRFFPRGNSSAPVRFTQTDSPAGNSFHSPEPIVTADGTLHVVWGDEPVAKPGANAHSILLNVWRGNFTGLWHMSYQHGKWSKPERVAKIDELVWNATSHAIPVATADGGFAVAAPALVRSPPGNMGEILIARWHNKRWTVSEVSIHVTLQPGYVTIASQGDTLVVGYMAPALGSASDVNSVFVIRSLDNGKTWGSPILVRRSGSTPAYIPQLLSLHDGSFGLVWNSGPNDRLDASTLSFTRSTDGGLTWSTPSDLAAAEQGDLRAAVDGCGRVVAVFERGTLPKMVVQTAQLDGARWSAITTPMPNRTEVSPSIASDRVGCVHVVWNSVDPDSVRVSRLRIDYETECPSHLKARGRE